MTMENKKSEKEILRLMNVAIITSAAIGFIIGCTACYLFTKI